MPALGISADAIMLYIFLVGAGVGLFSGILAVPIRIYLKFDSTHIIDKISQKIWNAPGVGMPRRIGHILICEYLLSHCLDKTLSTMLAVACVVILSTTAAEHASVVSMYRDLVELLTAYYFIALAYAVKSLKIELPPNELRLLVLLGPLGFFSVLLIIPTLLRLIAGI
ncbi:hypothetical protein L0222_27145 [bacterium]|nr:hypothetical protein [bacterium]